LAKKAFDHTDESGEENNPILSLIRDNLTIWTS